MRGFYKKISRYSTKSLENLVINYSIIRGDIKNNRNNKICPADNEIKSSDLPHFCSICHQFFSSESTKTYCPYQSKKYSYTKKEFLRRLTIAINNIKLILIRRRRKNEI